MHTLYSMLTLTLIFSTPIIIAGLGGLVTELSGVTNIALEGLMMFGAFVAATAIVFLERSTGILAGPLGPWIAVFIAALVGCLISMIHAFSSIHLQGDQIISATAVNFLAVGLTIYLSQLIFNQQRTANFLRGFIKTDVPILSNIPIIGNIFFSSIYPTVFLAIILSVILWFVINKTPFGLRLRAAGEHPTAVESAGVSVYKIRYIAVGISGSLAGLAGGIMVLTQDTQYTILSIHGTGFIALATMIFGQWRAFGVLGASLLFGFLQVLAIYSTSLPILNNLSQEIFNTVPYVLTICALIFFSKNTIAPKAIGVPYKRDTR